MNNPMFELVLRYQPSTKELEVLSRDLLAGQPKETSQNEFSLVLLNLGELADPETRWSTIGRMITSLLEAGSNPKQLMDPTAWSQLKEQVEQRAHRGDAAAQNSLGAICLEDSLRLRDLALLETAEQWFVKAAANGHEQAASFLSNAWPRVKAEYRTKITGAPSDLT